MSDAEPMVISDSDDQGDSGSANMSVASFAGGGVLLYGEEDDEDADDDMSDALRRVPPNQLPTNPGTAPSQVAPQSPGTAEVS